MYNMHTYMYIVKRPRSGEMAEFNSKFFKLQTNKRIKFSKKKLALQKRFLLEPREKGVVNEFMAGTELRYARAI